MNGVGLYFDVRFGFGLMNAGALISAALNWTKVPEKKICESQFGPLNKEILISSKKVFTFKFEISKCEVNYIEHVEIITNIEYSRRGALEIYLTSPQGTTVALMTARPKDNSKDGFVNWPLTCVAMWGEKANGLWMITLKDTTGEQNTGYVNPFTVIMHGTHEMPVHMKQGPRRYNNDYSFQQNLNNVIDKDFDDVTLYIPDEPSSEDSYNDESNIIDEIGQELLREHHSKPAIFKGIEIN